MEYRTVSAISSKELDNAVNRQLKTGFQPYGSPYVAGTGSGQLIYQTLVRVDGVPVTAEPSSNGAAAQIPQPPETQTASIGLAKMTA